MSVVSESCTGKETEEDFDVKSKNLCKEYILSTFQMRWLVKLVKFIAVKIYTVLDNTTFS